MSRLISVTLISAAITVAGLFAGAGHVLAASMDAAAQFKAVCESKAVKSDHLQAACATNAVPPTVKDGSRFKMQGVGAEVEILAANLKFFATADR